jgi:glycyl-tRNA synthetase beta chain
MEEVLFLVEWPTVAEGEFAPQHLALPAEVLEEAMQSHQRYFPLVSAGAAGAEAPTSAAAAGAKTAAGVQAAGALSNRFLYVSNGDPAWLAHITAGNERVLQGRIEDAEFSFEKDRATGLEAMAAQLGKIVFHVKAGTMKDKTDRLVALTRYLAEVTGAPGEARERALEAARLAKADQVSIMVREFADLEGVMGETYALMEGRDPIAAQAIREQFLPDAAGGAVPQTLAGALLATAEKVDNITAAFACGEPPSGSKDPYGLRRAAAGMVAIAAQHDLRYDVEALLHLAYDELERFPGLVDRASVVGEAVDFIVERLAKALTDDGIARDTVDAVLPASREFLDLRRRAEALQSFRTGPRWEDLVTVFTRPANLAKKLPLEAAAGPGTPSAGVSPSLFQAEAESALFAAWREATGNAAQAVEGRRYGEALTLLADLRPLVDRYFDDVLVMAEDEAVRTNRLRQLAAIAATVREVAWLDLVQG